MRKFSGNALECLNHMAKHYWPAKGSKNIYDIKKPVADFTGVSPKTITRWTSGQSVPQGEALIKLRFYLESFGYDVSELVSMKGTINYMLAEMLAFSVVTIEFVNIELSFAGTHSVLRISHGGKDSGTSPDRDEKIREMYGVFQKELVSAREQLRVKISESTVAKPEPDTDSEKKVEPVSGPALRVSVPVLVGSSADQELIEVTAKLVMAVTPLLERVVKSMSKEDRNKLRRLVGDTGMFKLSLASSRLCSEKALEIVRG